MKKNLEEHLHIGTSGWHYQHWKGNFYPQNIDDHDMLAYYAGKLRCVEINNSFYQWLEKKTLDMWIDTVPRNFLFCLKANRSITHFKKLQDPSHILPPLIKQAKVLGNHLGPVLFQLPPSWRVNSERLNDFLENLPHNYRYVFEFRDASWFTSEIYDILSAHRAAFCIYELGGVASPKRITADFIYVRLHGPDNKYEGCYDVRTLSGWAGAFSTWLRGGRKVFCFFDNDESGYAAKNAVKLQDMLCKG